MKIPLINICDFQGGTQPPKEEWIDHEEPGYVRMLQIRDFTQPNAENIEYIKETATTKKCTADDILIGRYGASVGKILTGLNGAYNVAIVKTIPDRKKIISRFLYYYLCSPYFQNYILSVGSRAAQAGFNKDDLKNALISLPDLNEQERVVTLLDKLGALISLRQQQLAKLDELVKARFVEMFGDPVENEKGWKKIALGELCEVGSSKRIFEKEYTTSGIPFYRTKEIVELSKGNKISTELFISPDRFEEIRSVFGTPQKDDLLISAVGTIGTIWVVDGTHEFYFKDGNLLRIVASPKFSSIFMKQLLEILLEHYKKKMSAGTAYSALTISGLNSMVVYDIPLSLQGKFSTFVEQIDKSKLTIQQSLDKLEVLKKALMQEYFG